MFRIRRIHDDVLPVNKEALKEVREIFVSQFPDAPAEDIGKLPDRLRNPFLKRFRTILYVAENSRHQVQGFAIVLHEPELQFCYLDFLATRKEVPGRGVGAALYEFVRDEAASLKVPGLFFECLPDDKDRCANPELCKLNGKRLKFYEQYGARPIVGTSYEHPVPGGTNDNLPHLVWDDLDSGRTLSLAYTREVVRAILERKYRELCPPDYVQLVVNSFQSDPVAIRPPRYFKKEPEHRHVQPGTAELIALTVNQKHEIHHIRERGYVESPVRINAILRELDASRLFEQVPVREYPLEHILAVHDPDLVDYLFRACQNAPERKSIYPYVFPIRNATRPPKDLAIRAGYYCIDTFTPIHRNAFLAARCAVDCVLTAADEILDGRRLAYSLVRPPGHHAERKTFGGFCYFSNAAVGAHYFSQHGKVAILDIDYHHGNGQQDIFYERSDVLTVSIHGDPDFAYPYFTGFADETGSGPGTGFNVNLPLPEQQDGAQYRVALNRALNIVNEFSPDFLVIALGLDPAKGDPTGTWSLTPRDFQENGKLIGGMQMPTLVVQEGGYRTRSLGQNAKAFFRGLVEGTAR